MCRHQSMPAVLSHRRAACRGSCRCSTPPMPHRTVSQSGMLSRSPGATHLPRRPMMVPPMSAQQEVDHVRSFATVCALDLPAHRPKSRAGRPASGSVPVSSGSRPGRRRRRRSRRRRSWRRARGSVRPLASVEREHAARSATASVTCFSTSSAVSSVSSDELAGGVLHADLDLHGSSFLSVRGRAVGQWSSVSG